MLRSQFFALGTVNEVIAVLSDEFGISDPRRRATAAEAVLTLDQSLLVYVVRKAEADGPIDLRSFVEISVNNTWHRLDAKELESLRALSFEKLRELELPFRIDEAGLRDELPASKRTTLKAGELLQIDAFDPFDGEDRLLQHGLHDVLETPSHRSADAVVAKVESLKRLNATTEHIEVAKRTRYRFVTP